jgi:hypothetical protein
LRRSARGGVFVVHSNYGVAMKRIRFLLGLCSFMVLGFGGLPASAQAAGHATWCSDGVIAPGDYADLVVAGNCVINGAVTISGNVMVLEGAYLDAAYSGTRLSIGGNVVVAKGAKLGLGCSFGYHDCGFSGTWLGAVTVDGNILANQALTMYLDFIIVHGNVGAYGGGDASLVDHPPAQDGLVFPIKDSAIDGNLVVDGWKGAWFGVIRDTVGGNVAVANTVGTRLGDDGLPDSTEVATNAISGNLLCYGNVPAAQIGDSGGSVNAVGGVKTGECAGL